MNSVHHEMREDPGGDLSGRSDDQDRRGGFRAEFEQARDAAAEQGERLATYARDRLADAAERQKAGIAAFLGEIAGSIRSVSKDVPDHPNLVAMVEQAAGIVQDGADSIAGKPLSEMRNDAEEVCRRHPIAVATGTVLLGALVAQLLKGGSSHTVKAGDSE